MTRDIETPTLLTRVFKYPEWIDCELAWITLVAGVIAGWFVGYNSSYGAIGIQPEYAAALWAVLGPFIMYPFMHFVSGRRWEKVDE